MRKIVSLLLVVVLVMGFVGMVSASSTAPYWNISGDWLLDFAGGTENREFVALEQDELGNVEGEFWWINNSGIWEYGGTLVGYVSGHSLYLFYDRNPIMNYVGEFEGSINQYGMSGTFTAIRPNGTTFGPVTWSTTGSPISLPKDAPAVAVELLKDAGISHRYGDRKSGGNHIADVAREMEDDGTFMGVKKWDTFEYKLAIAHFLNTKEDPAGVAYPQNTLNSVRFIPGAGGGDYYGQVAGDKLILEFAGNIYKSSSRYVYFKTTKHSLEYLWDGWAAMTWEIVNGNTLVVTSLSKFSIPRYVIDNYVIEVLGFEGTFGCSIVIPNGEVAITQ